MDSLQPGLRIFEIPETLDWRSLLRPPGAECVNYLDASEADDPEAWSEGDVLSALEVLSQSNFKNIGDCLNILSPELFNVIFNLNRYYANLEKQNQILLCQFISSLCTKVQVLLEAIPPKPYSSRKEASDNVIYEEFIDKMASLMASVTYIEDVDENMTETIEQRSEEVVVSPKSLGLVLRSLINVSVFLLGMCYNFVTTFEKSEGNATFELSKEKAKRSKKSKRDEKGSKINAMAIEALIDGMMTCCKYNLKIPYLSDYGGGSRPSVPMLRMLFQTLISTISLDEAVHTVSNTMLHSIARIIKIIFSTMQSSRVNHTYNSEAQSPVGSGAIEIQDSDEGHSEYEDSSGNSAYSQPDNGSSSNASAMEEMDVDKLIESDYEHEWMSMLIDEMKKQHCHVIVDVLDLLKDSNIPNIVVNELFMNIKENYSAQVSNTNQLVSSQVQNEFTNIGLFFEKMAKKVPCVVLSNISQLKQLFDVPCYALRKSIMESIKQLIILSKYYDGPGADEAALEMEVDKMMDQESSFESGRVSKDSEKYKMKVSKLCCRNREMLLETIISRQFDTYMYARAAVMKVLHDLVEADALPVRKYSLVVSFATARLMDKGSQVRQRALSLVSLIVDVVTNSKFLLALDTGKLTHELRIIESNTKKVNYLLSQHTMRRYSFNTSKETSPRRSESRSRASTPKRSRDTSTESTPIRSTSRESTPKRSRDKDRIDSARGSNKSISSRSASRQESVEFVDVVEYDYDEVLAELKSDFGSKVLDNLDELYSKLELAKELYTDALEISERVDVCLELCKRLLRSPTETDQKASIKFVCSCHLLGLQKATQMLPLVWALSWSNNQSVVESVLLEFKNVYFQSQQSSLHQTCNMLIDLINTGDLTCLSSVEKIFQINQNKQQLLNINLNKLIPLLIQIATTNSIEAGRAPKQERGRRGSSSDLVRCKTALNLIKIILSSSQNAYSSGENKELSNAVENEPGKQSRRVSFEKYDWDMGIFSGLLSRYNEEVLLEVCQILIYVSDEGGLKEFVQKILKMFLDYFGTNNFNWFQISQIVIDLTFVHLSNPLSIWSSIIKELLLQLTSEHIDGYHLNGSDGNHVNGSDTNHMSSKNKTDVRKLSHLVFIAGHVAIRSMIYVERVQNDLKVARSQLNEDELENNMGMATKDEKDREFFDNIIENKLVNDNLLGGPMFQIIMNTLVNPQKFVHPSGTEGSVNYFDHLYGKTTESFDDKETRPVHSCLECNILFICSVISICKFATISKKFCNIKFKERTIVQIIITLLVSTADWGTQIGNNVTQNSNLSGNKRDILNILKCNLLICYGDLLVRHPNVLEPMNDYVFKLLSYPVNEVRETAILVFSHLVMNDMIKPKGRLLDNIMFLTQDTNEKIANYARVFLNEIHRKNPNTIYNCFPEMLSTLSQPSSLYYNITNRVEGDGVDGEIGENSDFHGIKTNLKILNEVFNFVKNDKQEHLVEKICLRLNKAKTIFATAIYINALLLINYDEKNIVKLSKSLNMLRQLLSESQPLLAALWIIHKRIKSSKVQKVQGQVDIKEVSEEMINKVRNMLGQGKATMLIRASQFSEQIIELLNSGNYTSANLRTLFDREKQKESLLRVKKEDEDDLSSNTADYESNNEAYEMVRGDYSENWRDQSYPDSQQAFSNDDTSNVNTQDQFREQMSNSRGKKRPGRKRNAPRKKTRAIVESDTDSEEYEGREQGGFEEIVEEYTQKPKRATRGKKKKNNDEYLFDSSENEDFGEESPESEEDTEHKSGKRKSNRGRKKRANK
ncbi:condensin subunit [Theileria orientalis strain Shintoku]|uniref:Condensin subunit n=1 Tax=Theileria orientalis strain Shintoku TaxID=869250 RepID=J4DAU5_THEOR|nr:condensin subunit [Theileria orientalis strain Shintoku]BAM42190.1 condensin subunit [Theileria orientalis strain Shintoku]|eukprot:XP_009692491.1 condensin subunit [Theileria orientalis strain Shintoku]